MSTSSSQLSNSLMQKNKSINSTHEVEVEKEEGEGLILPILPREILLEIGKRNRCRLDASRIRSVCRTWRKSLPPPFRFPIKIPPPPGPAPKDDDAAYFITEVTFYADAANQMILAFEEEYRGGGFSCSAFLHNCLVEDTKLELPLLSKLSNNLSFLANAYHIHNAFPRFSRRNYRNFGKSDIFCNHDVLRTVIISSDASICNLNYARLCDLKVVAHLYDRKLAVLSLNGGAMNNDWEIGFCNSTFEDIVHYKGQLYAVDRSGAAFVMDYNSLHMTRVAPAYFDPPLIVPGKRKVLHLAVAASGEDLYMFSHDPGTVDNPKLYKLVKSYSSSSSQSQYSWWVEADQDLPDQVFVKDVRCNFHVARDLIRTYGVVEVPRFCPWPRYEYVRVSVGSKNRYHPSRLGRSCDLQDLPYLDYNKTPRLQ